MNLQQLKEQLRLIADKPGDMEIDYMRADNLLLQYINDPEVTALFERIEKYYA